MQVDEPSPEEELLSAEVVLHSSAGEAPEAVSSANLARHQPDPALAAQVRDWFRRRGFDTSDMHGISFSVTGPRRLFEETCQTPLGGENSRAGVDVLELPTPAEMPRELADGIVAVTFTPPPDFGPGSY